MAKKSISIIIPVYNNLFYTKICLKNLYEFQSEWQNLNFDVHIIVVDDGSTDGTSQWIEENYPNVYIVKGDGNLWWSGGINAGAKYAVSELNSDYTLWWNNDVLAPNDYFVRLFNLLEEFDNTYIIGSRIDFKVRDTGSALGGMFNPKTGNKELIRKKLAESDHLPEFIDCDWLPGMGTLIHRSVYEKIGYCDDLNFPQYHGDSDFTFRAKKSGFRVIVKPDLIIINDNTNTGIIHEGSFKRLYYSLFKIKSNYNIKKNILFYKIHASSKRAYIPLVRFYFGYLGGFLKWKFLSIFGITKKY